jgi:hypothetical protein
MPFQTQDARPYTKDVVRRLADSQMGVYGILRNQEWIYIGSGDIKERLLAHLNGDNPCILKENPTHFVAELAQYPVSREKELTNELGPICNKRAG